MKMPTAIGRMSKAGFTDFFLRHGEKFGFFVVALLGAWFVWSGIRAIVAGRPTADMLPAAISAAASAAASHVNQSKDPPAEKLVSGDAAELAKQMAAWKKPDVKPTVVTVPLDKPLFNEFAKRTKPDVFPIESLRAQAGVAVLPKRGSLMGQGQMSIGGMPSMFSSRREEKDGSDGPAADSGTFPGMMPAGPRAAAEPGRIVPFVVVTGLVPYGKQLAEYELRYSESSHRDPERDEPKWSDYLVERAEVNAAGDPTWEKIDMKVVTEQASREWAGLSPELLPPTCLLTFEIPGLRNERNPVSRLAYAMPLPRRIDQSWGVEAIHPWFEELLVKQRDEAKARMDRLAKRQGAAMGPGMPGLGGFAGMMPGGMMMQSEMEERGMSGRGFGTGGGGSVFTEEDLSDAADYVENDAATGPKAVEYRLFRFIDTNVEPGKSYRYRVRLSVWNPNWKLHPQHLASEDVAAPPKLPSTASDPSPPVRVPSTNQVLVRSLDREEAGRAKRGFVEALLLGEDPETGNYTMRSVPLDRGGFANLSKSGGKQEDAADPPLSITTDSLLLDMAGKQDGDARNRKPKDPVAEPVELLFLRDDGSLEMVTAADSQRTADRYLDTLPRPVDPRAEKKPGSPFGPFASPFGDDSADEKGARDGAGAPEQRPSQMRRGSR